MKNIKKALAIIVSVAMLITVLIVPASADEHATGLILPTASGCGFEFAHMVEGQTVKECSDSVCCTTNGFNLERSWWYKEVPLPTVVQDGSRVGVLTVQDGDLYYDGIKLTVRPENEPIEAGTSYTIVLEVSTMTGMFTEDSDVELNGKDMIFESKSDTVTGNNTDCALFAVTFFPLSQDAPHGVFMADGHSSGVLSNVSNRNEYSTDGGNSWIKCSGDNEHLDGIAPGTIQVAYDGDHSKIEYIYVDMAEAPVNLYVTNCTTSANNDGVINGVNGTMQYIAEGGSSYTDCTGDKITGLKPGNYYVRTEANGQMLASGDVKLTVGGHDTKLPEITKQVVDAKIDTGKDATFTVEAKGEELVYEWHYIAVRDNVDRIINDTNAKYYYAGYNTNTLTVKDVNSQGTHEFDCEYFGDKYYCIVKNPAGQVQSNMGMYVVNHVAGKEWESDSQSHWNLCVCGAIMNKAYHVDKNKDGKCDVCGFDMSNSKVFTIKSGANQTWTTGTKGTLEIVCDGALEEFKALLVDKNEVDPKYYTKESGSTIIKIKDEYLNTLTDKIHSITLKYADGSVTTALVVTNGQARNPDDPTQPTNPTDPTSPTQPVNPSNNNSGFTTITWILLGLIVLILIVLAFLIYVQLKRQKRKK